MPTCQPNNTAAANPQEVNLSAVRTYHLFWWLRETPAGLSMDDINQRFLTCPDVGKSFSDDTVCLYINTLRQLGCDIRRPAPSNQHRYQLHSHPFHRFYLPEPPSPPTDTATQHNPTDYTAEHLIQQVAAFKESMGDHLTHGEHLTLDGLLVRLLHNSPQPHLAPTGPSAGQALLFHQARCIDYQPHQALIAQLEDALNDNDAWLFITYASPKATSPTDTHPSYYVQPRALQYQGGALYLLGTRLGSTAHLARLRVDRIRHCERTTPPPNELTPTAPSTENAPVLSVETPVTIISFQLLLSRYAPAHDDLSPIPESATWKDWLTSLSRQGILMDVFTHEMILPQPHTVSGTMANSLPCIQVTGHCTDDFLLEQALFQAPYPVKILTPSHWAERYTTALAAMARRYHTPAPTPALH